MSSISPSMSRGDLPQFGGHRAGAQKSAFQKENEAVLQALAKSSLEEAEVSGGKGGFCKATVVIDGRARELFLKKIDEYEFSNYAFVQKECAGKEDESILKYMPRVYGRFQNYIVMENLRSSDGKEWTQLADLKISAGGQSDQEELAATNRPKGYFEMAVMLAQDKAAPNFLFLEKSKVMRSVNALMGSEEIFATALRKATLPLSVLMKMRNELTELLQLLTNSPMAFIGCSIFIFVSEDRKDVKIRLADPAHGIAKPGTESKDKNVFYAFQESKFEDRLKANKQAVGEMIARVSAMIPQVPAKKAMQENVRPRAQTELKIGVRRQDRNATDDKVHHFSEIELQEIKHELGKELGEY